MAYQKTLFLSAFLGAFLNLGSSVAAETEKKAASQLTLEERSAARQAEIARQRRTEDGKGSDLRQVHISGAVTPELLLPIELFRHLMFIAFDPNPDARDHVRRGMLDRATKAGITLPPDFWLRLESSAPEYLESNRTAERLGNSVSPASGERKPGIESADRDRTSVLRELRRLKASQCELREAALRNARTEFGSQWFDHFLYGAVAPIVQVVITGEEPADPTALLRDVQGGCQ
jgi:hypothetical protein